MYICVYLIHVENDNKMIVIKKSNHREPPKPKLKNFVSALHLIATCFVLVLLEKLVSCRYVKKSNFNNPYSALATPVRNCITTWGRYIILVLSDSWMKELDREDVENGKCSMYLTFEDRPPKPSEVDIDIACKPQDFFGCYISLCTRYVLLCLEIRSYRSQKHFV